MSNTAGKAMNASFACPFCSHALSTELGKHAPVRCPECAREFKQGNGTGVDVHETGLAGDSATLAPEMLHFLAASKPSAGERTAPVGYEILEPLGRGGMGVVYKARDTQLDRVVALKMIRRGGDASAEDIQRFRTEAEAVARLHHANVVQIHAIGEHERLPFFSLEYCAGGSLEKRLRGTPLLPADAARLVSVLSRAMHEAHARGIIHRDLKPANILLAVAGEQATVDSKADTAIDPRSSVLDLQSSTPKISDFGLAKKLDAPGQTQTGMVMGTPSYMAPEQAAGTKEVGPAADIYALGAILYETLTGRPPFKAATSMDTILQVLNEEPLAPSKLNAKTPRDLETICLKCLQKNPAHRYLTALELADDLDRFRSGEPIRARRTPLWERAIKWARRRPAAAALLAACGLVIVMLLVVWRVVDQRLQHDQAAERVEALATASAEGVSYVLDALHPLKQPALPILRERFAQAEGRSKVRLACGLAALGEPPVDFLADAVAQVPASPGECRALLDSFRRSEGSQPMLFERFGRPIDASQKVRYAVLLLYLDDARAAQVCLGLGADPTLRTAFIHDFAGWHADLKVIARALTTADDSGVRSGLCLALATLDRRLLTEEERVRFQEVLSRLFREAPDGGTHSAAGLALRRWALAEPKLSATAKPRPGHGWFLNSKGMTMIRVEAGEFVAGEPKKELATSYFHLSHKVTLTRPYFIADREVTVEQFREFEKESLPPHEKPHDWPGPDPLISPTPDCPVQRVSWYDAILYCNWLSKREGRTPCYVFRNMAPAQKGAAPLPIWDCLWDADGYRLPTDAEWERACRAGTTSGYFYGEDELLLHRYGTYSSGQKKATNPVGTLLPNPWGFFDMHANLWEWCWDVFENYTVEPTMDPRGPDPSKSSAGRVVRGGGVANRGGDWRSSARGETYPTYRNYNQGFRIACKAD